MGFWDDLNGEKYKNRLRYGKDRNCQERAEFNAKQQKIDEQFQHDLAVEHGVLGHPKFAKAYAIAYAKGHSSGYSEIAIEFSDLVGLIKD